MFVAAVVTHDVNLGSSIGTDLTYLSALLRLSIFIWALPCDDFSISCFFKYSSKKSSCFFSVEIASCFAFREPFRFLTVWPLELAIAFRLFDYVVLVEPVESLEHCCDGWAMKLAAASFSRERYSVLISSSVIVRSEYKIGCFRIISLGVECNGWVSSSTRTPALVSCLESAMSLWNLKEEWLCCVKN